MSDLQLDLFGATMAQEFDVWVHTHGGRHVARDIYRLAWRYSKRFLRYGRKVSMKLLWELERDQIVEVRRRLRQRNIDLDKYEGYALNNDFTAYMARHIVSHRPEWSGMFELREVGRKPSKKPIFVKAGTVIERAG